MIQQVSKRQSGIRAELEMAKNVWRKSATHLCFCGKLADRNPHHIIPRSVRPDLVCNPKNFLGICWDLHQWIDRNRALAYTLGLLGHSWDSLDALAKAREKFRREIERLHP